MKQITIILMLVCSGVTSLKSATIVVDEIVVEHGFLNVTATVECGTTSQTTTHQIRIDEDGLPTVLPSGWVLDTNGYLIYSESPDCGGSVNLAIPLGENGEVQTDKIIELHTCGGTTCECCSYRYEGDRIIGCQCVNTNCDIGVCGHTVTQVYVPD